MEAAERVTLGRLAGAALLVAAVLLLGTFGQLLLTDRSAVATLLIVFALITVPALFAAVAAFAPAVTLLRTGRAERPAAVSSALLAVGHVGVVAISLRPGIDGEFDAGDWTSATVGAVGLAAALLALAVSVRWRTLGLRLVAAFGAGVLALGVVVASAVAQTD